MLGAGRAFEGFLSFGDQGLLGPAAERAERNGRPSMLEASSALGFVCLALVHEGARLYCGGPT
jgi:hypothetical protein